MTHPSIEKGILLIIILAVLSPIPTAMGNAIQTSQAAPQPTLDPGNYTLLILAPQDFVSTLQPLVTHKDNKGVPTVLKTLSDVDSTILLGRDEAEKVKYYIETAITQWGIQYVLLVGGRSSQFKDTWWFPVRYASSPDDWETQYLSDLYFADIYDTTGNFSTWDSNQNGLYAEWHVNQTAADTGIDYIPDIAVGRIPARTIREVRTIVNKIITYETTAFDSTWFPTMLVAAGDTYPQSENPIWTGAEGEFYGDQAIEKMTGFTPTRLYTSDETFTSKTDIINAMSAGYGFVYFVGHGSPKQWGNHPFNSTTFIQGPNSNDMRKFRNQDRLPVCVVSGCHNSQFDVQLRRIFNATLRWRQEYIPECWSERSLSASNGGMVATIGVTGLGYTKEDKDSFQGGINELERAFFNAYGNNNSLHLGDAWVSAITWYATAYPIDPSGPGGSDTWIDSKVAASWVILGDPSLQIGGYS